MTNWQELATMSHYRTAVAVRDALLSGQKEEAMQGIEELIDALSRADRRALRRHLIRLMQHIIKWRMQPGRRSRSWAATIQNARSEIATLQEDTPSLTRRVIEDMWESCLHAARNEAEGEMDMPVHPLTLTWDEVFETAYIITS
jgi:hypothetical protein